MTLKESLPLSRGFGLNADLHSMIARQCSAQVAVPYADMHSERERLSPSVDQEGYAEMRLAHTIAMALKMAQDPIPITINNIAASQSEAHQKSAMMQAGPSEPARRPSMEIIGDMFNTFFSSNLNRICFAGMCGVGVYIYWSYLDHKWRMDEVQRRIDSNFLLRINQWLFNDSQLMNGPRVAPTAMQSTTKLLPFIW
jgi:hypothetical protein